MISAQQCEEAAELLVDRQMLVEQIERTRSATKLRLGYLRQAKPHEDERYLWSEGVEFAPTPELMALLLTGPESELATIDAKLRKLGVEPPATKKGKAA